MRNSCGPIFIDNKGLGILAIFAKLFIYLVDCDHYKVRKLSVLGEIKYLSPYKLIKLSCKFKYFKLFNNPLLKYLIEQVVKPHYYKYKNFNCLQQPFANQWIPLLPILF